MVDLPVAGIVNGRNIDIFVFFVGGVVGIGGCGYDGLGIFYICISGGVNLLIFIKCT